jgi:hypothetical protein
VPPVPELRYPDLPVVARKDDIAADLSYLLDVVFPVYNCSVKNTKLLIFCLVL